MESEVRSFVRKRVTAPYLFPNVLPSPLYSNADPEEYLKRQSIPVRKNDRLVRLLIVVGERPMGRRSMQRGVGFDPERAQVFWSFFLAAGKRMLLRMMR